WEWCGHAGKASATIMITASPIPNLSGILPPLTCVGVRSINSALTLSAAWAVDAGGWRGSVGGGGVIGKAPSGFIEPSQGLLKQAWLGIPRRDRALDDVELVFVHVDARKSPRLILVIRELHLTSFDEIDNSPHEQRQLSIPLHELPRCVVHRTPDI